MATVTRLVAALSLLVGVAAAAAAAQPLEPEWSRPVGGRTRFVGVEEYGRCSVFVDHGTIQVVAPSGAVSWTWRFSTISKFINPREVAVSHDCDAIAFVGDATYKYVWIVDAAGTSAAIKLAATPADVEFDRGGAFVAIGTYSGTLLLYSRNGTFQWERQTKARVVDGLWFPEVIPELRFNNWAGQGQVSLAGLVQWSRPEGEEPDEPTMPPGGSYQWRIAMSNDGQHTWWRGEDSIDCVDATGAVLATIRAQPSVRGVMVSRDFGQVLIVTEKDLTPVSVERYVVPAGCKP